MAKQLHHAPSTRARCLKHWYPIFTANKQFVSENKPVYCQLIQHILKKVLEFFTVFIFALALKKYQAIHNNCTTYCWKLHWRYFNLLKSMKSHKNRAIVIRPGLSLTLTHFPLQSQFTSWKVNNQKIMNQNTWITDLGSKFWAMLESNFMLKKL